MEKLCQCLERVVVELRQLEKKAAMEKMAVFQREFKEETLEFMLVEENGEKLYKIVTQKEIDSTLAGTDLRNNYSCSDYQRQKPLGTQPTKERRNPFTETISQENNSSESVQVLFVPIYSMISGSDG